MVSKKELEQELQDACVRYYNDPGGFTDFMFDWGHGQLAEWDGPDWWHREIFAEVKAYLEGPETQPLCIAVSSGHGAAKTAFVSWLELWFMSCRPHPQVVTTANTETQLTTKTWRELAKWHKMAAVREWFEWTATSFYLKAHPETWKANAIPWSENNTEAFAGTHEDNVLVVFDEACHDDQTDVLTDGGWKRFADVSDNDKLYSMDANTGIAEYLKPSRLISMPYVGTMYHYKQRGADFSVTPNHEMIIRTPDGKGGLGGVRKVKVSELTRCQHRFPRACSWIGEDKKTFELPALKTERRDYPAKLMDMDTWLEFLGWFCSEGHLVYKSGLARTVGITNKNLDRVEELVCILGFNYAKSISPETPQLLIFGTQLAQWLHELGKGCLNKTIPSFIRYLSSRQIDIFLSSYREGDGYIKDGKSVFYTSSMAMADGLQELILKTGKSSSVCVRKIAGQRKIINGHVAESSVDGYVVSELISREISYYPSNMTLEQYSGMVYCAEVPPHHNLLTRRNGCVLWSGNSKISDKIWEVTDGIFTTKKNIWLVCGNGTRNVGRFYDCFHKNKKLWKTWTIDSRTCKAANRAYLDRLIEQYGGESSDQARVRVLGLFPKTATRQLISTEAVEKAMKYEAEGWEYLPKVMGVDIARFGENSSTICVRQGRKVFDIEVLPKQDLMTTAHCVAESIKKHRPLQVFVDGSGIGAGVVDRLRQMNFSVVDVNGGNSSINPRFLNKRAEMWWEGKEFVEGLCELPKDRRLLEELTCVEYDYTDKGRIRMDRKTDIMEQYGFSPDCFVGDTEIETPDGRRRIDSLVVGDSVITPFGNDKIIKVWVSETDCITTASFSNGSALIGKGSHKIFCWNKGSVRLDTLALTDVISSYSQKEDFTWAAKISNLSSMVGKSIGFRQAVDITSQAGKVTPNGFCIAVFGLMFMGIFQEIWSSITGMATGAITILKTLSANYALTTAGTTCSKYTLSSGISTWQDLQKQEKQLKHGMQAMKALLGIARTEKKHGLGESLSKQNAVNVEMHSRLISSQEQSSVLNRALSPFSSKLTSMIQGIVSFAEKCLLQTGTEKQPIVPVSVVTETGFKRKVYNLTLANHNAYYANQILVYNCADALMLTFAYPISDMDEPGLLLEPAQFDD